jgi:hypothetical protein
MNKPAFYEEKGRDEERKQSTHTLGTSHEKSFPEEGINSLRCLETERGNKTN